MLTDGWLGRYRIIEKIGSGGMGEVYLAEDEKLSRQIALKTLPLDVASDAERMRRFTHEAKTASALNHPNIITIFEISDEGQAPYIAMEYVRGDTLGKAIKSGNLGLETILDVASQVAGALAAAHEANIVHRDIKPDNIIRRPDGLVKVLDFGLAKLTENDGFSDPDAETVAHRTNPGMILGTASYMSPEQARGKVIDGRSDIFSFGIVLYQMLAGRLPFRGENYVDVIGAILHKEPRPLGEVVDDVPPEVDALVRKCLRKDREERFQTARELSADLTDLRHSLDIEIRSGKRDVRKSDPAIEIVTDEALALGVTTTTNERFATTSISQILVEEAKLHPLRALGVLLLVLIGIGGSSLGISKFTAESAPVFHSIKFERLTNSGNLESTLATISPEGKLIAYAVRAGDVQSLWVRQATADNAIQVVPPAKVEYMGLAFSPDSGYLYYSVRDESGTSTMYKMAALGSPPRRMATGADGPITASPSGAQIAYVENSVNLKVINANGGDPAMVSAATNGNRWISISWAPDGRSIAGSYYSPGDSKHHLALVDVATGAHAPFPGPQWLRTTGVAWLGDGTGLMVAARDLESQQAQIWFVSYPGGEVQRITNDINAYVGVSVANNGSSIVTVQESRNANLWEIDTANGGMPHRITNALGTEDGASGVAWAPDGRIVYTTRSKGTPDIWITSKHTSSSQQLTVDAGSNFKPAVSPDGRFIAFVSTRGGTPSIWRMDINGENAVQLANNEATLGEPEFTPDGAHIIYYGVDADEMCSVWQVPVMGGMPVKLTGDADACRPEISGDGRSLVYFTGFGRPDSPYRLAVHPIDGSEGPRIMDLPDVAGKRVFTFSADGSAILYLKREKDADNIWSQPLDLSPPVRLTNFDSDRIYAFDVSPTGELLLSRGHESTDAVLITGLTK
jgi:eukaryotic-like serine/threonine-protein kinase